MDRPGTHRIKAAQELQQGAFARPGGADNGDTFAGIHPQAHTVEDAHGLFAIVAAIPGFDAFSADSTSLAIFRVVVLCVLAAAALGAFTRATVPPGAALYFVVAGLMRQPTWPYHTGLVPLYALAVLAFLL